MILLILTFFGVIAFIQGIQLFSRWRETRKLAKLHGCKPCPVEYPYDFFGFQKIISSTRHIMNHTALDNTIELFEKYGNTFASRIATQRVFFTCHPKNIKHVLMSRFVDYDASSVRAALFRPITAHGIFAVDGQEWKVARDVYRGQFSNTRSIVDLEMHEGHIQRFLAKIPPAGTAFDIQPLFLKLFLDITSQFAMGDSVDCLSPTQSQEKKEFVEALLYVKKIMARDGFLGPAAAILSRKQFYRNCKDVHRYVEKRIQRVLEKRAQDLKTGSVESKDSKDDKDKDPAGFNLLQGLTANTTEVEELRDGATTIMVAAIDSVNSLLSNCFFLLARNPRVYQKVRAEILEKIGHERPTFEQLKSLTYLRYVFNESMRVYPPVPFNARTANKDTTLPVGGGPDGNSAVLVKKGQRVVFSSWATHRSFETFGKDAHDFIPERWENITANSLLGYLPFNLGPRACPGQNIAITEASHVAVRLIQTFSSINNRDDRAWKEHFGLNISNENGVVIDLVREGQELKN